jgi:hypothetical protein
VRLGHLFSAAKSDYLLLMEQAEVVAFPARGEVFLDHRGEARALRLAWHTEADVVVLSLWQADRCSGSFRLALEDVPRFVAALVEGLGAAANLPAAQAARLRLNRPARSASATAI